jgi:hypothetical protein
MITGFNTDVDHQGRVFHVQTEDKGLQNPVVESLIYCGGEIIASRSESYSELTENGGYAEEDLLRRMEAQHLGMIREIRNCKYDDEAPLPFGHNIITNRSLDDVILEFLHEGMPSVPIKLELVEYQVMEEGTSPTLHLKVMDEENEEPVGGARVVVRLLSTEGEPRELFSAASGGDGCIEATFEIPALPGADSAILCHASAGAQSAEFRQLVVKGKSRSSRAS